MAIKEASTRTLAEIDFSTVAAFENLYKGYCSSDRISRQKGTTPCPCTTTSDIRATKGETSTDVTCCIPARIVRGKAVLGQVSNWQDDARRNLLRDSAVELCRVFVSSGIMSHGPFSAPAEPPSPLQARAITNRLRSLADDEVSQPILDIDEAVMLSGFSAAAQPVGSGQIRASASFLRRVEPTRAPGFGRTSAALLLWLESSDDTNEA